MPFHCNLVDPLADKGVIRPFGLGNDGFPMFECIRLLMGSVDVENNRSTRIVKLRRCYVSQSNRKLGQRTLGKLVGTIFENDLTVEEFGKYLDKGGNDNRGFWEKVKSELCLSLVAEKGGQYLHAFLHLYRVIELISIALPLVYASTEPDYGKALELLKSLNQTDAGELAVLRSLSAHIAKSGEYEDLKLSFVYPNADELWKTEASKQFNKYVLEQGRVGEVKDDNSGFEAKFAQVPSLVVNTRNRMFHRKITGHNFDLDKLDGVDLICQTVTDQTLYWLSLTVIEILKVHSRRYI
jgi:hypothetical protein